MIRGTVHAPFAQHIAHRCRTQFHSQYASMHAVIHLGNFRVRLIRVRHQIQLNNASPLDILIAQLMGCRRLLLEQARAFDSRDCSLRTVLLPW